MFCNKCKKGFLSYSRTHGNDSCFFLFLYEIKKVGFLLQDDATANNFSARFTIFLLKAPFHLIEQRKLFLRIREGFQQAYQYSHSYPLGEFSRVREIETLSRWVALECMRKGQVIQATFPFNLSRNIVALQVAKRCCPYYHRVLNFRCNNFQCCKLKTMLQKVELGFTLRNILLQLATLKFVAWQVEHGVVIRATARSNCNARMFRDKLKENIARIAWP